MPKGERVNTVSVNFIQEVTPQQMGSVMVPKTSPLLWNSQGQGATRLKEVVDSKAFTVQPLAKSSSTQAGTTTQRAIMHPP